MLSEQQIQAKRIKYYEALNFFVIKLIVTNRPGIPDLLAVKGDEVIFEEVKRKNGKLSEIQKFRIKELQSFGIKASTYFGQ